MKPFRAVKDAVAKYINKESEKKKEEEKLDRWKRRLQDSLNSHSGFRAKAAEWDLQYHGSKSVKALTSNNFRGSNTDEDAEQTKKARQVVNITMQLIEAQIDITVPKPRVDAIEGQEDLEKRKMIEGMLTYMSSGPEMEKINSENERIVKKNSICVYKVDYDPNKGGRSFKGKIQVLNPHPINFIPQNGVYRLEDMDYCFHIENRTISQVGRMYGEEFEDILDDEHAEYYFLEDIANGGSNSENNGSTGMVSVVEAWYRDKDGDIGLLVWANETILKDMPKFYYKRDEAGQIITEEEVEMSVADPMTGAPTSQTVTVEVRVPTNFPFVIQHNIPVEKCYYGKADPDIISDQQEGIKKMLSNEEEKQIKGTTKIFVREGTDIKNKLTNAVTQVIECADPTGDVQVVDLKTQEQGMLNLYNIYVQAAKDVLGITEASQGRAENANLSGKALEQLSQLTQSRLSIKQFEKNIAYTKLYRLIYEFIIAFYDDKIPYRIQGEANSSEFGVFDKGMLIKQDAAGEWYYPEFDIYIEADQGMSKDKNFIMQVADKAVENGAADAVDYWTILASIGFPYAQYILDRVKERVKIQQEQAQQQADMQQNMQNQEMDMKNKEMEMKNTNEQQKIQMQEQAMMKKAEAEQAKQEEQQPKEENTVNTDLVAQAISEMDPEEQKQFFSLPEEEQMRIVEEMMQGGK